MSFREGLTSLLGWRSSTVLRSWNSASFSRVSASRCAMSSVVWMRRRWSVCTLKIFSYSSGLEDSNCRHRWMFIGRSLSCTAIRRKMGE